MTGFESDGWPAPAKLNLFLHIIGRRADGYHLLQTAFQFLDYGDTLHFDSAPWGTVSRVEGPESLPEANDLCVHAARLLLRETGLHEGVRMRLNKRLPMGGGLGGGSSDAATVLVALNSLWRAGLSVDELAVLGLALGADVPVFVRGVSAWAEGVGECLTPLPDLPVPWYAVIKPPVSIATVDLFSEPKLTRDCAPITIRDFLSGAGGNVFEAVARVRYPAVAVALDYLSKYAPARLTGTGACVFAAFVDVDSARRALHDLPGGWSGFVARGCNMSPLQDRLRTMSVGRGAA
ncbi:4-(cytidine 5'-diphospho)-2-C-methyl-D-erythritol kinase [Acidihalobacter yilgarnensis]|uniref:4-diphosphocytidyl-2-C-methyl-D-erythritol kinase n=1 Tax=Acidihalobacter yilgarnensis TaxID=2819280 RepID=A0A1D8IKE4_9GAMM|nr:4-(cytidine 5'-diphospho)-2-C-methyl-D-erythritol kinase [Acidihalobacter yilgarnensis]AOU96928.1 4-(cytidine 5'-diphospho)-2-C-methyl-D-erythritol kinase [Acidihalobacter yilgarnensis]